LETAAQNWRTEIGIADGQRVLLVAGKFEDKKRPVALMEAFLRHAPADLILIMVGDGELGGQVRALTTREPARFRVLPFQNQSRMPLVYRLGDALVLPSAYGETWGLAVNEALACGRPVLVSDRVGCHADVIRPGVNGEVFTADDWNDFGRKLAGFNFTGGEARRNELKKWSLNWSIEKTEQTLVAGARQVAAAK
jgi:glycosyltransferase involved in cell wall biosynthesis